MHKVYLISKERILTLVIVSKFIDTNSWIFTELYLYRVFTFNIRYFVWQSLIRITRVIYRYFRKCKVEKIGRFEDQSKIYDKYD